MRHFAVMHTLILTVMGGIGSRPQLTWKIFIPRNTSIESIPWHLGLAHHTGELLELVESVCDS
jgi:hypothetical protein